MNTSRSTIATTNIVVEVDTVGEVERTKPTTKQMAIATTLLGKPAGVGDRVPFWNGVEVAYYVITKGDMVKVDRFRSRLDKQRQHLSDKLAREDREAERALTAARKAEADRRSALSAEAAARIAASL